MPTNGSIASGFASENKTSNGFPGVTNYTNITEYQLGALLGQGNYASVKAATHKDTNMSVAIKIYDKFKLSANVQVKKSVSREMKLLMQLSATSKEYRGSGFGQGHKNIMRLYDAIEMPKQLYLIMENVPGKILHEVLRDQPRRLLSEKVSARIFKQVISALKCFHREDIAHRDLKPENILVDTTNSEYPLTKVIDFGFAAQSQQKLQVFCGTPAYMSPEICAKGKYDGPAADMWAAGILLYTMMFGYQPFRAQQEKDLFKKIGKGQY